jgi:D-aspartate ligase
MRNIIPVLLGADLNCYSIARAFHEAYGVVSFAFGKYSLGETEYSKIVIFKKVEALSDEEVMLDTLLCFAELHKDDDLFLFGCTDEYQQAIIKNQNILKKYYFFSCPSCDLADKLASKERFCNICFHYNLPHPQTRIFRLESDYSVLPPSSLGFDYPIIVKPSSSIEYWRNPFNEMKKVYIANNEEEAANIISNIYSSGYGDSVILQEYIEGPEDNMYVLTSYSDRNAKVRMMCMGRVLLGEHTPKGLGNHVAILTEPHESIMKRVADFLEKIAYKGFANFDIKFNASDGEFYILEMNLRTGRSNYYVTASGENIARFAVADSKNTFNTGNILCKNEMLWHTVPKQIIYKYISDEETKQRVRNLIVNKKARSTLFYPFDMKLNPLRSCFVYIHNLRYFKKYKIYE